jgi:3alpha(or 20beta)-hydroxysteroid dehydrogenase
MQGKVAIVTGAAGGQGAAEAKMFLTAGAKVVLTDITESGKQVAAELGDNAHFVVHDVSKEADWARVIHETLARFARLDVLVNNAGVYKPMTLRETSVDLWDLHYRVNQLGVFLGMRAALEPMIKSGGGSIINVSSKAGMMKGPNMFAYASSKWAVRGMSQLAAAEYTSLGIRVNAIFPGMIDTPMLLENDPASLSKYRQIIPMQRAGTPDEVARLVLFLASDLSSYMSGAEIAIDGGF